jgi:hypothetical protein
MMLKDILKDERGTVSAARTFLLGVLLFTGTIIVLDSIILAVPEIAYTLLGSLNVGLLAWAGGPRVAQYLAPQIGAVASGIAQAVKNPKRPKLLDNSPDFKENDER